MEFGERLRIIRDAQGLSQAELARRLGLSTSAISGYESGARQLSVKELPNLSRALGLDRRLFFDDKNWHEVELLVEESERVKAQVLHEAERIMGLYRDDNAPAPQESGRAQPQSAPNRRTLRTEHPTDSSRRYEARQPFWPLVPSELVPALAG